MKPCCVCGKETDNYLMVKIPTGEDETKFVYPVHRDCCRKVGIKKIMNKIIEREANC